MNDPEVMPPEGAMVKAEANMPVAMSIAEVHNSLDFVRQLMRQEMREGQDYGKIPGCGDKPTLLQPGAQKLLMTFRLQEFVRKEVLRELPNYHREYEFTVAVRAPNGKEWDGVGTCSTLEAKYRYRKGERKCPKCGKPTIIAGKKEYGGGWLCWQKKGGCGAKFEASDAAITSQSVDQTENPNPPDTWNTVRKMGFKRALVHAAINATNTSELWTQDLEDMAGDFETPTEAPPSRPAASTERFDDASATKTQQKQENAPTGRTEAPKHATDATRQWMLKGLQARPGDPNRAITQEFFVKSGVLLETEELESVPLRYVPITTDQLKLLVAAIGAFELGEEAKFPYAANDAPPAAEAKKPAAPKPTRPVDAGDDLPENLAGIIVPIPRKGMKRDEYLKAPDTIGSLWAARHEDEAARSRLFGFVSHYEPKGWQKRDGTQMPPSAADIKFREALDEFADWYEENHPDKKD